MDSETVKVLVGAATNFAAVMLGALVSWVTTNAAERRKARREDDQAEKREIRTHLLERLARQKAALHEYQLMLAKWADDPSPSGLTSARSATLQRSSTVRSESHADAAAISLQIGDAFGSPDFGEQAGMTVAAQVQGWMDQRVAMMNHILIPKCIHEMQRSIDAHSDQLALPRPRVVPELPIPADVFLRGKKRTIIESEGLRAGLNPKFVEELLKRLGLGDGKVEAKPAPEDDSG